MTEVNQIPSEPQTTVNVEVTPENAYNVDLSALKAAVDAPPAAAEPAPEPPKAPEPIRGEGYTITRSDAGIELKLDPEYGGEVFKGKDFEEVAPQLAKAKIEANKYARTLKSQQAPRDPETGQFVRAAEPAKALSDQDVETKYYEIWNTQGLRAADMFKAEQRPEWILDTFAKAMKLKDGNDLLSRFEKVSITSEQAEASNLAAAFHAQNQDFPASEENSSKLLSYCADNQLDPTNLNHLRAAHRGCIAEGKYQALSQDAISKQFVEQHKPNTRPSPPPVLTTTRTDDTPAVNPYKIPLSELKKLAGL